MPLAGLVKLQVEKQLGCIAPASDRGRQGPLGRLKAWTTIDGRLGGEPEPEPGKLDRRMPAIAEQPRGWMRRRTRWRWQRLCGTGGFEPDPAPERIGMTGLVWGQVRETA